jgi:hypothetical protein
MVSVDQGLCKAEGKTNLSFSHLGSWDSKVPVGYKLSVVEFDNGEPNAPSTSKTGYTDIMANHDVTTCYTSDCFRPVGLAWDSQGRLFMSSDATGEIYAIVRKNGQPVNSGSATGTSTGTASSSTPTGASSATSYSALAVLFGILAFVL